MFNFAQLARSRSLFDTHLDGCPTGCARQRRRRRMYTGGYRWRDYPIGGAKRTRAQNGLMVALLDI